MLAAPKINLHLTYGVSSCLHSFKFRNDFVYSFIILHFVTNATRKLLLSFRLCGSLYFNPLRTNGFTRGSILEMEIVGSNEEVRNSALKQTVISKFNKEYGSDTSIFKEFKEEKERLELKKKDIENALSVNGVGVPSKISLALKHAQDALDKINEMSQQHLVLKQSVMDYKEKVDKIKTKADDYICKINELERACEYLKIIERIGEISNMIEIGLNEKNEKKQEINYMMLKSVYNSLKGVKCHHLLIYANETLHYWHNILKDKLGNDYMDVLKAIKWPSVGDYLESVPTFETLNRFQILTEHLLHIELDDDATNSSRSDGKPLSVPMAMLIKPLRKRFIYHFMGSRQTNRADKPEWYFTQILSWIRDNQDFVDRNVQPVYDKIKRTDELAKIEFIRGLTELAVEKLHYELPELQYDDSLFSHCIDEALGFEKELRKGYGYPDDKPGVVSVLTQAPIFVKWINMERRYATEKMDKFLGSDSAFETFVSREVDEYRITECAEAFLSLLSTITERYEMLPQPGHRLQFVQLQLDLIDDFRIRLLQKLKEQSTDPLHSTFPNILNTAHYVRNVLEDLGTNTFFLQLHFYKSKLEGKKECEGTIFDEYLNIFAVMRDEFLNELIDHVFMDIKAKSMHYRKDKWHAMDSQKDLVQPSITATACPMFHVLIKRLHELQEILASSLFKQVWNSLASKLDQYIYEEIVAICIFNEGGAAQFSYDITKNLFPLFGQYSSKPEAHFKLLKDACLLLTMPIGLALTLRDTLLNTCESSDDYDIGEVLTEVGIFAMKKDEVLSLLSRRTDIN